MYLAGVSVVYIILLILILAAWLVSISLMIKAAKEKGYHRDGAGKLWFIGIFASPVVLGLYTASLPDRNVPLAKSNVDDELPAI